MRGVHGVLVVLLLHGLHAPHALHAQSVRDILSIPMPSDLVAAPGGRAVAWIANEQGRRNIWVAEAPRFTARRLTAYRDDDGQPLSQLVWTADARALLYVRGGAPGSNWDVAVPVSPTSDPEGGEQVIWYVALAGGSPRRVSEGHSPSPSPANDRLAFILRDTLRVGPLRGPGGTWIQLRVRGTNAQPRWSPDGSRLAFSSNRGDHAFIGVYQPSRDEITWIAPGSWRDNFPRWSRDGDRLAFIRRTGLPFAQGATLPPLRDSTLGPFMIMVAALERPGEAATVFRSSPGPDGALPGLGGDWTLQWAAGDTLLFATEQGGWLGLNRITTAGGVPARLTPLHCEIRDVRLVAGEVMYASNCGDVDRMHIQRVAVAGGEPRTVTSGQGLEWAPWPLANGRVFALRSTARCPATPGFADAPLTCDGFDWTVEPRQVVVHAADSTPIHLQVFSAVWPIPDRPAPVVLFFHGGPQRQMLLGWHDRGYYHSAYGFNQLLASRGFVVVSVNYRGGIGYGRAFREAPRRGRLGASEYQDVLAAAEWARRIGPIGLWGGSYGGYLTALGLARNSDLFAAGFDLHGVHDYAVTRQGQTQGSDSAVAVARRASPVGDLSRWRSPVLLVAGDDDRNVEFQQTTDLALRLRRLGVTVEEIVFPDDVHSFLRHENWVRAYEAGLAFLERQLKK